MEIQLLGTSAAEGYPGVFCKCKACEKARDLGGKNIRTRTSAIIDQTIKIDFPPDTYHHVLTHALDLGDIEHLIFTHTHHDHFYPDDLRMRQPGFAHEVPYPLHIYGNDVVMSRCKATLRTLGDQFELHPLRAFKTFQIRGYYITPLLADHNPLETCFIFHVQREGKALLYGNDTGWFPDETWEWLEGKKLDVVTLDCTNGLIPERHNHLNIEAVKEIKDIFMNKGIINKESRVIATHFSHNIHLTHQDLEKQLNPYDIEVAYDGMKIEF